MDLERQKDIASHMHEVGNLTDPALQAIAALAEQLNGQKVMPVVGAGASYDCGMRLAGEIAVDFLSAFEASADLGPLDSNLDPGNLVDIAEGILRQKDQSRVVAELGIPEDELWKPSETMGDHFCVFCVLARMVREGLLDKSMGFNYDCGGEAGLDSEGFVYEEATPGEEWPDHATVIADGEMVKDTEQDGAFTLYKAHGCAQRYRHVAKTDEPKAAEAIVICRSQLHDWVTKAGWSRKKFNSFAEDHILVLIGFSAQDPKFSKELRPILDEVHTHREGNGTPRVVVIDPHPDTEILEELIEAGYGGKDPLDGVFAQVGTKPSTITAAMMVLLAEMLAIRLEPKLSEAGLSLPTDLDQKLGALLVSLPAMARWYYLLKGPGEDNFMQRTNVMAQRGYVPLTQDPPMKKVAVKLTATRAKLRERLGLEDFETSEEVMDSHGFIIDAGRARALMPVGIEHEELKRICGIRSGLETIKETLAAPRNLDLILISGDGATLRGVSLDSGEGVDLE